MLIPSFLLGTCVGSFLNVVIHRLPRMATRASNSTDVGVLGHDKPARYNLAFPHSHCPSCGHPLRPWENIPVISYVLLRGRCSCCKTPISLRYPAIELAGGLLAILNVVQHGPTPLALAGFMFCASLLAVVIIALETTLIPGSLTLPLLATGLACSFAGILQPPIVTTTGAMAGVICLWFSRQRDIGVLTMGAAIGAWLGPMLLGLAMLLALPLSLSVAFCQQLHGRKASSIYEPCLAGCAALAWLVAGTQSL
ncbi:prepilin peptidase [Chromobacterium haemolyticum]|uniref:prepilin peptidase n=1 Tax=Chromobacterium haemolyticum TaxID=394935 RepID=UPI002449FEA5|nr:prepilin peptidase [Chromobacterium haemolyticum]MDH0342171.1 prepilin peptidase [Chromobacterium haemolyticum]